MAYQEDCNFLEKFLTEEYVKSKPGEKMKRLSFSKRWLLKRLSKTRTLSFN